MCHGKQQLQFTRLATGQTADCEIEWTQLNGRFQIAFTESVSEDLRYSSSVDFDEALQALRTDFEKMGLQLHCARFAKNAFVSSLVRQSSGGLACYLVRFGRPVNPRTIVHSLSPTDPATTAHHSTNAAFIRRWVWSCRFLYPLGFFDRLRNR